MTPAAAAAAAGTFLPDGSNMSNMSSYSGVMAQPASSTVSINSGRPAAASVTSSNPMSRANAVQRGLQVDDKGTVVVPQKVDPMQMSSAAGMAGMPYVNAGHLPLISALPGPGPPAFMQVRFCCSVLEGGILYIPEGAVAFC
jgi:hypothetical protein